MVSVRVMTRLPMPEQRWKECYSVVYSALRIQHSAFASPSPPLQNPEDRRLRRPCRPRNVPLPEVAVLDEVRYSADLEPGNAVEFSHLRHCRSLHVFAQAVIARLQLPCALGGAGAGCKRDKSAGVDPVITGPLMRRK